MITDTEAIVLRQVKTVSGRRMILLFSREYGKISVGTGMTEGGKSKSALAVRPFTNGRYELFKGRDSYNLNNAQVLKSFYQIGEDLDKYMAASYILELTEKILPEEMPQPVLYSILLDFMEALEKRSRKHETLVMAYMVKALDALGSMPQLDNCVCCGRQDGLSSFSVAEGGMVCGECAKMLAEGSNPALIYDTNFDIVNILRYFQKKPFQAFEKLALDTDVQQKLQKIMRSYLSYHLDVKELKSETFFTTGLQ